MTTTNLTENLPELEKLNVLEALNTKLDDREFVYPSFPMGKVGLLAGSGGSGKSFFALQSIFQVSAGKYCNFGLGGVTVKNEFANVLYVTLEDEAYDCSLRIRAIGEFWGRYDNVHGTDKKEWLEDLSDFITILPLAGQGVTLVDSNAQATNYLKAIFLKANSIPNLRLVVVDTLRRAHDCDENSNGDMSKVLRHFEVLAKNTGAAVLLVHHENKMGQGNSTIGAGAVRGASSIVDNARYVMRLQTMTVEEAEKRGVSGEERPYWVRASLEKTNYGKPQPEAWLFRSPDSGVLTSRTPPKASTSSVRKIGYGRDE